MTITMMSELPQDLVEEVLCRVPATSLKRIRSSCKRWNRLFSDSRFTKKHLDKAAKQFLVLMLRKEYRICSMNLNLHHQIPSIELTGELNLNDSHSNSAKINICKVFHCDGLLLCTLREGTRIVVWNPCTGQTKWIWHRRKQNQEYTLGSSNDSYKILCHTTHDGDRREFEICEINSTNSWRILQVVTPYCNLVYITSGVSLQGKTYFVAVEEKQEEGVFLVSFDYAIEKFGPLCRLPKCPDRKNVALSLVRQEKLSVFLQDRVTSKTEIWVTNKIDEGQVVSWSKLFTVDYPQSDFWLSFTFLVDEEKKVVVGCED